MTATGRSALVVHESMFDNTADLAEAVARGLRGVGFEAHCVSVRSSASLGPTAVDLVVLGAPTHAFSLSRTSTRADAVRQGAPADRAEPGAREWIAAARPDSFGTERIAVFDTRVSKVRRLPLAAGPTAAKLVRRQGFRLLRKPTAFLVEDTHGPLADGEVERAEAWGTMLGAACLQELDDAT